MASLNPADVPLPADNDPYYQQQPESMSGPSSVSSVTSSTARMQQTGGSESSVESGAEGPKSRETTVPAACLACRSKHLKCDGQNPCVRCIASQSECTYVPSRRGYKGPRRGAAPNPAKRQATSPPDVSDCPMLLGSRNGSGGGGGYTSASSTGTPASLMVSGTPSHTPGSDPGSDGAPSQVQLYKSYCSVTGIDPVGYAMAHGAPNKAMPPPPPPPPLLPVKTVAERCLDSYYHHFFAAHPFVLPREHLMRLAREMPAMSPALEPLLAAMRWVGSLFIDVASSRDALFDEAYRIIFTPAHERPRDGFLLQAMIVLIVGLDGCCQQDRAREILGEAERLALDIDINTRPFATHHGHNIPVLEESWRRTWWDLFVVDGMVAGVHRVTNFLLFDMPSDAALPCEEHEYISGNIPIPLYLEDLEDRDFADEEREFSSFAYRILCARNLGRFMRTPPIHGPDDENLARLEAHLTNWRLHLPPAKRDALTSDGRLDEMMFQAHMMMHATSILLHQPHSQLDTAPTQAINSCAPHQMVPGGDLFNSHTKHVVAAASAISDMVTHRVSLLSHTHFFTCVLTLSSIVHLSRWALFFVPCGDDDLRQQVRLNIGALNRLAGVWTAADRARGQVKTVAHEIYTAKKQQRLNSQIWLGLTQEDVLSTLATDESIIREIDSMQVLPGLLG